MTASDRANDAILASLRIFWVPVLVTQEGYAKVFAMSPEEALVLAEEGDFHDDQIVALERVSVAVTGVPEDRI